MLGHVSTTTKPTCAESPTSCQSLIGLKQNGPFVIKTCTKFQPIITSTRGNTVRFGPIWLPHNPNPKKNTRLKSEPIQHKKERKEKHYWDSDTVTKTHPFLFLALSLFLWKGFYFIFFVLFWFFFCIIENKNYDVILFPDNCRCGFVEPTDSAEQDDDVIDTDGWDFAAPSELLLESSSTTVKNGVEIEEDY